MGARPDGRCDMRLCPIFRPIIYTYAITHFMFTFTELQQVLSEFAYILIVIHSFAEPCSSLQKFGVSIRHSDFEKIVGTGQTDGRTDGRNATLRRPNTSVIRPLDDAIKNARSLMDSAMQRVVCNEYYFRDF